MSRIVIATAEPFGQYHLAPLVGQLRKHEVLHLVPDTESREPGLLSTKAHPTGPDKVATTTDREVIREADLVVVTGGTLVEWTRRVAEEANQLLAPVVYVQLAVTGSDPFGGSVPQLAAISASSAMDAVAVAKHLKVPVSEVMVTGIPALDGQRIEWNPQPGRVLLLTNVSIELPKGERLLAEVGEKLLRDGYEVRVRFHPREAKKVWSRFQPDITTSIIEAAATAEFVVGYPTTAMALVAALGLPIIAVTPGPITRNLIPESHYAICSATIVSLDELPNAIRELHSPELGIVEQFTGPVGGAGKRIVEGWERVIRKSKERRN